MKKIFSLLAAGLFLLLFNGCSPQAGPDSISIVPVPGYMELVPASKTLAPGFTMACDSVFRKQGEILLHLISEYTGLSGDFTQNTKADIILRFDPSPGTPEAYGLEIRKTNCLITAGDTAGIVHGLYTLLQVIMQSNEKEGVIKLPGMLIEDHPRFSWRGMHLDVSRHFFSVDFIKKYIDILALYKMNVFHWHLTDDQGWRIEIKQYPDLTRKGAFREDTRDRPWSYDQFPVREGKPVYGGFYTQDEIREVVQIGRASWGEKG